MQRPTRQLLGANLVPRCVQDSAARLLGKVITNPASRGGGWKLDRGNEFFEENVFIIRVVDYPEPLTTSIPAEPVFKDRKNILSRMAICFHRVEPIQRSLSWEAFVVC